MEEGVLYLHYYKVVAI